MPLRRAVTKVRLLPETEAWASHMHKSGAVVQYALLLEQTKMQDRRCYWTVELSAGGKLWRRYYVSPDGTKLLTEGEPRTAVY